LDVGSHFDDDSVCRGIESWKPAFGCDRRTYGAYKEDDRLNNPEDQGGSRATPRIAQVHIIILCGLATLWRFMFIDCNHRRVSHYRLPVVMDAKLLEIALKHLALASQSIHILLQSLSRL
jgi:hypothetical protein